MCVFVIMVCNVPLDNTHIYRYPHLSCELLTCEVEAIINTLSESEQLMGMLWAFLDRNEPLDPLLGRCMYIVDVFSCTCTYRYVYSCVRIIYLFLTKVEELSMCNVFHVNQCLLKNTYTRTVSMHVFNYTVLQAKF